MFQALSAGGKIKMLLEKQIWGDIFGALTDQLGLIGWSILVSNSFSEFAEMKNQEADGHQEKKS